MAFYTNFATEFFHTVFTRRSVLKGTLRRNQKVIFVKSPISSPMVMWLIPKLLEMEKKRLCARAWGCAREINTRGLRKSADRKAQIRKAFVPLTGLNGAFRSADFLRWCLSPERDLTHNLFFLFPIVFGILILIRFAAASFQERLSFGGGWASKTHEGKLEWHDTYSKSETWLCECHKIVSTCKQTLRHAKSGRI